MDTELSHWFNWLKTSSNFEDNKNLNNIETDYRDDKNLNQVNIDYKDNKNDIEIEINYRNNEDKFEIKTNYGNEKKSIFLKIAANCNRPQPHPCPANILDSSNKTASKAKFDIIQSSLLANLMVVGLGLLTSTANWKYGSTWNIYA